MYCTEVKLTKTDAMNHPAILSVGKTVPQLEEKLLRVNCSKRIIFDMIVFLNAGVVVVLVVFGLSAAPFKGLPHSILHEVYIRLLKALWVPDHCITRM